MTNTDLCVWLSLLLRSATVERERSTRSRWATWSSFMFRGTSTSGSTVERWMRKWGRTERWIPPIDWTRGRSHPTPIGSAAHSLHVTGPTEAVEWHLFYSPPYLLSPCKLVTTPPPPLSSPVCLAVQKYWVDICKIYTRSIWIKKTTMLWERCRTHMHTHLHVRAHILYIL